MPDQTDHRVQAALALVNELTGQKLDLIAHVLALEERLKTAEATAKPTEDTPTE